MTGLRVTYNREWPAIFEKHPVPWSRDVVGDTGRSVIIDANGVCIDTSRHPGRVATWLFELYLYVVADAYAGITGWVPTAILRSRPLPWSIEEQATEIATDEAHVWQCATASTQDPTHLCTYGTTGSMPSSSAYFVRYKTTTVRQYYLRDAERSVLVTAYEKWIIVALYELSRLAWGRQQLEEYRRCQGSG